MTTTVPTFSDKPWPDLQLSPSCIEGRFYRYGFEEYLFDKQVRDEPVKGLEACGFEYSQKRIHFLKKLLAAPAPTCDRALKKIAHTYRMLSWEARRKNGMEPARLLSKCITYEQRYLARHPDDQSERSTVVETIIDGLLHEAYGISKNDWLNQGMPCLPESLTTVDQSLVREVISQLAHISLDGPFFPEFQVNSLALALKLNRLEETRRFAFDAFAASLDHYDETNPFVERVRALFGGP